MSEDETAPGIDPDRAPATRRPSGLPQWPVIVLAETGDADAAHHTAAFAASPIISRTYWLEVGELRVDRYGPEQLPGADIAVLEHDGTFPSILDQVERATQVPPDADGQTLLVIAGGTRIWELLTQEQAVLAAASTRRQTLQALKPMLTDQGESGIKRDQWVTAKMRWAALWNAVNAHPGPVVFIVRLDEKYGADEDSALKQGWRVRAEKDLVFDAQIVVYLVADGQALITKAPAVEQAWPADQKLVADFSLEELLDRLGLTSGAATLRPAVALKPRGILDEFSEDLAAGLVRAIGRAQDERELGKVGERIALLVEAAKILPDQEKHLRVEFDKRKRNLTGQPEPDDARPAELPAVSEVHDPDPDHVREDADPGDEPEPTPETEPAGQSHAAESVTGADVSAPQTAEAAPAEPGAAAPQDDLGDPFPLEDPIDPVAKLTGEIESTQTTADLERLARTCVDLFRSGEVSRQQGWDLRNALDARREQLAPAA